MSDVGVNNFLYLNRRGCWDGMHWSGLELGPDGALRLMSLPRASTPAPAGLASQPAPAGAAGIAVAPDGTVWYTDPERHRLYVDNPCAAGPAAVHCVGGEGSGVSQFRCPRGLMYHRARRALFAADSGNGRLQVLDPVTTQVVDVWDGTGGLVGGPASDPTLVSPVHLGQDRGGNVYVLDDGDRTLRKLDPRGAPVWRLNRGGPGPVDSEPEDQLAAADAAGAGGVELFVFDAATATVSVIDGDGNTVRRSAPTGVTFTSMAVDGPHLYAADRAARTLLKYYRDFADGQALRLIGTAAAFEAPAAGIVVDGGRLLVNTGGGRAPLLLELAGAYVQRGFVTGGPFDDPSLRTEQYHRLKASLASQPGGGAAAAVRLLTCTLPPGAAGAPDPAATDPFATGPWVTHAPGAPECLFPGGPSDRVWVAVELSGEGAQTPALRQLRLDFDYQTYLNHLPAVYSQDAQSRDVLTRLLALLGGCYDEVEDRFDDLATALQPAAAPGAFLAWLADWLALGPDGGWNDAQLRRALAAAYDAYGRRGTPAGLLEAVRLFVGIDARVDEPILFAGPWTLARDGQSGCEMPCAPAAGLGMGTVLAAAQPEGAVLGTSAVLDQSQLIGDDESGAPLFNTLAHRFNLYLYRGGRYSRRRHEQVRALVEREKPAHVLAHVCAVAPAMRVGYQARVGIDAIVGGPPEPEGLSGGPLVLGGRMRGSLPL